MEATAILDCIDKAFPLQPISRMTLRQAVLADQSLKRSISEEEWQSERLKDGHLTWKLWEDEDLVECRDGLAHLDEEAFAYYSGAFLKWSMWHVEAITGKERSLQSSIMFSFTNQSNYNLARLKRLDESQIDGVIEFLRFVVAKGGIHSADASRAMANYWLTSNARQKNLVYSP